MYVNNSQDIEDMFSNTFYQPHTNLSNNDEKGNIFDTSLYTAINYTYTNIFVCKNICSNMYLDILE